MKNLMDVPEVCDYLGLSEQTLANWRWRKIGPPFIKVGGRIKYDEADVDEWLDEQREPAGTA